MSTPEPGAPLGWVVVVPVKPAAQGKSRLAGHLTPGRRARLVRAMALDTVAAARRTPSVERAVVVTADEKLRAALAGLADLVDDPGGGLNAAVRAGIAQTPDPSCGVAVLLGDLPALRAHDLTEVLALAAAHERALVADAGGTGTTVLTALPGVEVDPRFGPGSAAAHERAGHVRLAVPPTSSARRDVDVPEDLDEVHLLGVGDATAALLGPRHRVVDGERFTVGRRDGGYDFGWDSGPNVGYGFSVRRSDGEVLEGAELDELARGFLADVDPRTGFIE